jgi:2-isopropylmalate synthase
VALERLGEFSIMAGGDRLEGCLFSNGRAHRLNLDLVNVALNLYMR